MRTLLFLFIASFFSTTGLASIGCQSTDGSMRVFIEAGEGYVSSIKILKPVELRQIKESLPAGVCVFNDLTKLVHDVRSLKRIICFV